MQFEENEPNGKRGIAHTTTDIRRNSTKKCADCVRSVAYQGVEGSYSSMAVEEYFHNDKNATRTGYPTFDATIRAVRKDKATHALLPIENSTAGRVADLHHLLSESELTIIGEHFLPVRHALIALKGAVIGDITHAYSHREALSQCTKTLRKLSIEPVPYGDTAKAVTFIAQEKNKGFAAVASVRAAELNDDVHILKEDIQDIADNTTRFLVLAKNPVNTPSNKTCITSIVYDVLDIPAALYESLGAFARYEVNIIKLESFVPMHRHKSAHFYLECLGRADTPPLQSALEELKTLTKNMRVLGTYEKSASREHFKG